MFHFHKMSDWSIIEKGKVVDRNHSQDVIGTYLTQERYCFKCGKTQVKTVSTTRLMPGYNKLIPGSIKQNIKQDTHS